MLTATSLLAANVDVMLASLCEPAGGRGLGMTFDRSLSIGERRRAAMAGDISVVWSCGLLAAKSLESGELRGTVRLAPVFADRSRPVYQSLIVTRTDGPDCMRRAEGRVLAVNERESWSGHHALIELLHRRSLSIDMFRRVVLSGSHVASIRAVLRGEADLAAIDDSLWCWMECDGQTRGLRVIDRTPDWPAPPLVFAEGLASQDAQRLETILRQLEPGRVWGLRGFELARSSDYARMLAISRSQTLRSPRDRGS